MTLLKQSVAWMLCWVLLVATSVSAAGAQGSAAQGQAAQDADLTPKELDDLVSPIALYPDALVAQILAGATYPDQITAAHDWLNANPTLKDQALMEAADKQDWDPSVKALTQFPSVLDKMTMNLAWTSALGEASYYQQKDVMAAIQRLRKQAKSAGNLKSGEQIKIVQQDPQTIIIQPASPTVVYVPVYNPTVVYGTPYYPPGYSSADLAAVAIISFGVGMMIGAAINNSCCGWGWHYGGWGCGWRGGTVVYQRNVYVSRSVVYGGGYRRGYGGGYYGGPRPTPYNRGNYNTGNINTGNRQTNIGNVNINTGGNANVNRPNAGTRPATTPGGNTNVNPPNASTRPAPNTSSREAWRNSGGQAGGNNARPTTADRGYGQRPAPNTNSGAFSGYNKGGNARAESSRGRSSATGAAAGARPQARPSGGRSK
jgi:hypothetical protein